MNHSQQQHAAAATADHAEHKDPVCGMTVAADSPLHHSHQNVEYFFCSDHCLDKFVADPERYQQKVTAASHEPVESSPTICPDGSCAVGPTRYTCPMHPEIRQDHPGGQA